MTGKRLTDIPAINSPHGQMKRFLLLGGVTVVSVGAELARQRQDESPVRTARPQGLVELELKLARADLELTRKGADLDEKRIAFGSILEQYPRSELFPDPPPTESAGSGEPVELTVPQREGMTAEEFLKAGSEFMGELHAACSRNIEDDDDLDRSRKLFAEMREDRHVLGLEEAMEEAGNELLEKRRSEQLVLDRDRDAVEDAEEVDSLPLEEKIPALAERIERKLRLQGKEGDLEEVRKRKSALNPLIDRLYEKRVEEAPLVETVLASRVSDLEDELILIEENTNTGR